MQSLRDKLLQAGVVTQEQAEKSKARLEKRERPTAAQHVESEKDRERRLNRELADRQKKIRALCDEGEVQERGEQAFYFRTRKRELRRLYLTPAQVAELEKGELAIVDRPNGNDRPHALVPRAIAERVKGLEEKALRFWAKSATEKYGFEDDAEAPDPDPTSEPTGS